MKQLLLPIFTFLITNVAAQNKLVGRVLNEDLIPVSSVKILDENLNILGETDSTGNFHIVVDKNPSLLRFVEINHEEKLIKDFSKCQLVEVILLSRFTYCIPSNRKIDRLRKRQFHKSNKIFSYAFTQNIFHSYKPCYKSIFIPLKPELDKISKVSDEIKNKNLNAFDNLKAGDTINVPFDQTYNYDGTPRTTLNSWSSVTRETKFECFIEGIIIEKNISKKEITFKITSTKQCNFPALIFEKKEIIPGQTITYNMEYFKVITQ